MMPHPTAMPFAWDDDVQRPARALLCALLFAVVTFGGGIAAIGHAHHAPATPSAASVVSAPDSAPPPATAP